MEKGGVKDRKVSDRRVNGRGVNVRGIVSTRATKERRRLRSHSGKNIRVVGTHRAHNLRANTRNSLHGCMYVP